MRSLGEAVPLAYGKALAAKDRRAGGDTKVYGSSGPVGTHDRALLTGPAVLVGRKGSAGSVHYSAGPCWPIDTAYYAVPAPDVDLRYVYYLLQWLRLARLDQSTAIPSLGRDTYNELVAPFPRLEVQRRIVARIDELFSELDDGEEGLRRARADLETYRKSLLKAAVTGDLTADWRVTNSADETGADLLRRIVDERRSCAVANGKAARLRDADTPPPKIDALPPLPDGWVWATIRQLSDFLTSGSRGWSSFYSVAGATFIRAQNINKDWLDLNDIAFVRLPAKAEGTRSRVQRGDLLVTITGANVTKTALVDRDIDEAYVSQHVALLRLCEHISSEFAWLWLVTPAGGRRQLEAAAYGAGKPGLNLPNILDVTIPLPPLAEQNEICRAVQAELADFETLARGMASPSELATLRQSILAAAFRGELV